MIYVVLGMHKSGTTLVARALHESGIDMGDFDPALGYSDGNTYERHATQAANRALLRGLLVPPLGHVLRRRHRPALDAAGHPRNQDSQAYVRWGALERRLAEDGRIKTLLDPLIHDGQVRHDDWGFKDPRTCLTWAAWRRHLPPHRIVAVYRGLGQVLARSRSGPRHPFRALRVLWSWTLYNREVLRAVETAGPDALLIRYERLMSGEAELERLGRFLGRPVRDARNPALHRSRGARAIPDWVRPLRGLLPADPFVLEGRLDALSLARPSESPSFKEVPSS